MPAGSRRYEMRRYEMRRYKIRMLLEISNDNLERR
jgi:hypothetical protein